MKLRVLRASPPLAEGVLCICRKQMDSPDDFLASAGSCNLMFRAGRFLMVFGFNRLKPLNKNELEPVRELWRKHNFAFVQSPGKLPLASLSRQELHPAGGGDER